MSSFSLGNKKEQLDQKTWGVRIDLRSTVMFWEKTSSISNLGRHSEEISSVFSDCLKLSPTLIRLHPNFFRKCFLIS